jgi:hypothetical protein
MRIAGAIILIIGILMTVYTGFTYVTKEKVVDLGKLQITRDDEHTVNWQPYVGIGTMVVGAGILIFAGKKSLTT